MAERPNAPDCKSDARKGYVGSNPTPSSPNINRETNTGPHSSEVEHVLGKNGVAGSIPAVGSIYAEEVSSRDG